MRLPLPAARLQADRAAVHPQRQRRRVQGRRLPARRRRRRKRAAAGSSYTAHLERQGHPGGEVLFAFAPPPAAVQAISGRQGESGPLYLYARIRPELKVEKATAVREHAVFLLDTSLSEHPDRFAVSMKLLRKILEGDPDIKQLQRPDLQRRRRLGRAEGLARQHHGGPREGAGAARRHLLLEGATDLSAALDKLVRPGFAVDGRHAAERASCSPMARSPGARPTSAPLVARFEAAVRSRTRFHCYRTGLGRRQPGAVRGPDPQGRRHLQLLQRGRPRRRAAAHRSQCLQVRERPLRRRSGGRATS